MIKYQISDRPVEGEEWDLLGMAVYAERLAEYISDVEIQFTLGVYGAWGEGKTSFVNLLRDKLQQRLESELREQLMANSANSAALANSAASADNLEERLAEQLKTRFAFIEFSAWPYATADDLWRALILKITQELCGSLPAKPKEPSGLRDQLKKEALLLVPPRKITPAAEPTAAEKALAEKNSACGRLLQWADQAAYSGISKGANEQLQLNQEVALLALARAGVEALSAMSPLVRAVRGFLGFESDLDMTALFQKEKSEVKQDSIDSIQQLQRDGKRLFDQIKGQRRVYVFVDDLDRCLPDVALDLLEAIKNFLNVGLVFIVAADEALIGQGLRLRYKELVSRVSAEEMDKFITQKGREYFEKIIQFGVRVPTRTPEQAHRYVAAQFPQWQPATDIIQTAIGTNPRRLKQYCNLLTYKRLVGDIPLSMSDQKASNGLPPAIPTDLPTAPPKTAVQSQPLILTQELYDRLLAELRNCLTQLGFPNLQGMFLDYRIRQWRKAIPFEEYSGDDINLLTAIVDTLMDDFNEHGNGLLLFLAVLKEKAPEDTECFTYISEMIMELMGSQQSEPDDA